MMTIDLTNARVLVVAASGGIGRATADAFAAASADVARPDGGELDITDDAAVDAYFAKAPAFDHVAIAAAQTKTGSVADLTLADAQAAMNNKFFGAYRVATNPFATKSSVTVDGGDTIAS